MHRFRCENIDCTVVIVVEQVDGVTAAYAQFKPGSRGTLTEIGLAMADRAGVRLAAVLGMLEAASSGRIE